MEFHGLHISALGAIAGGERKESSAQVSSPVATAEFSKFAGILRAALS